MNKEELISQALEVMKKAYVPYSHFQVGAALFADNGKIYAGCNVENASYGLTICAERNAITSAVADGAKSIAMIAVTGNTPGPITPCGACRQVIAEFASPETQVICTNTKGDEKVYTVEEILPAGFILKNEDKQ